MALAPAAGFNWENEKDENGKHICPPGFWSDAEREVATLRERLAQERARALQAEFMAVHSCFETNPACERHDWTDDDWLREAREQIGKGGK